MTGIQEFVQVRGTGITIRQEGEVNGNRSEEEEGTADIMAKREGRPECKYRIDRGAARERRVWQSRA